MPEPRSRVVSQHHGTGVKPGRPGLDVDKQPTGMAFSLYIESQDGRKREAMPWALYNGYEWRDDGGKKGEVLTLLFVNRAVVITGRYFKEHLRYIESCRLKGIRHNNTAEATEIDAWNETAEPAEREAVVTRVEFTPAEFEEVVQSTLARRELEDDSQD